MFRSVLPLRQVESLVLVPGRVQQRPLAALSAGEAVYLLDPLEAEPNMIHSVYGHPVTCLDASGSRVAFGVKRIDWAMHDGGNKVASSSLSFILTQSLESYYIHLFYSYSTYYPSLSDRNLVSPYSS